MTFITEDMKLAVKNGSNWLDENYPGWASRINLDNLEMVNCDLCIIGQAAMDTGLHYWDVVDKVTDYAGIETGVAWAISNGFDIDLDVDDIFTDSNEYTQDAIKVLAGLETLWTEEVKKRLE